MPYLVLFSVGVFVGPVDGGDAEPVTFGGDGIASAVIGVGCCFPLFIVHHHPQKRISESVLKTQCNHLVFGEAFKVFQFDDKTGSFLVFLRFGVHSLGTGACWI